MLEIQEKKPDTESQNKYAITEKITLHISDCEVRAFKGYFTLNDKKEGAKGGEVEPVTYYKFNTSTEFFPAARKAFSHSAEAYAIIAEKYGIDPSMPIEDMVHLLHRKVKQDGFGSDRLDRINFISSFTNSDKADLRSIEYAPTKHKNPNGEEKIYDSIEFRYVSSNNKENNQLKISFSNPYQLNSILIKFLDSLNPKSKSKTYEALGLDECLSTEKNAGMLASSIMDKMDNKRLGIY